MAYVDLEKAFDRINRTLLYYKLRSLGFGNKMYKSIKSLYSSSHASVNVNGFLTDWFQTDYGVPQGDALSPTLFGIYINDLAIDLKGCTNGINIGDLILHALCYVDDLALISDSEINLQKMLDAVFLWCKRWRMRVNVNKTKVVHHRVKGHPTNKFNFTYGNENIQIVSQYKYLDVIMDEHLDFNILTSTLASSANRALGSIYTKFHNLKGLGCFTFYKNCITVV